MNRIAFVIPGLDRVGGAERQVLLLARGLAFRDWRVSVVALSGSGGIAARELAASGIAFLGLGMRKGLADPRGWLQFHRWLKREKPDILHAHLPHAAWLARWSRLMAPVPVVIDTLHSSSTGKWGRRIGYRASNWLTDCVTAVSQAVADAHLAAHLTTRRKLRVLANGVELKPGYPDPSVREDLRRELGLRDELLWFAAGRLEPVKDYPTLLCALALAPGTAHLAIAGDGALRSDLHKLAAALGLRERVHFLGFCPDVDGWMQAADAFVLSSLWEGLPMAALEAAAAGLPSAATDVPGTHEVVLDGRTGFLSPSGSATALAGAMTRLMRMEPADRMQMGRRARSFVEQNFDLESVLDKWEGLYTELLAQNPARRHRGVPARR